MSDTHRKYQYGAVILAGLLLCTASVGIAFAFQGIFTDSADSEDIDTHWVKVGSTAKIAVDTTDLAVDIDTKSTLSGTTYSLSTTQSHGTYDSANKTVTFSHIYIGTLIFTGSDSSVTDGALTITLSGNDVNGVKVVLNGTYTEFTVGTPVEVYVDIIVSSSAVEGSTAPVVTTPAFTMNVLAVVTE